MHAVIAWPTRLAYWLAPEAAAAAGVLTASAAAAAPLLVSAVLPVAASPFITPLLAIAELAAVDVSALPLSARLQPDAALNTTIAATINTCLAALCLNSRFITALPCRSSQAAHRRTDSPATRVVLDAFERRGCC
jgi:hypothetical protein